MEQYSELANYSYHPRNLFRWMHTTTVLIPRYSTVVRKHDILVFMFTSIYFFAQWRNMGAFLMVFVALIAGLMPHITNASSLEQKVTITPWKDCAASLDAKSSNLREFVTTIDSLLVDSFFPIQKEMVRLAPVCDFSIPKDSQKKTTSLTLKYADTVYRPRIYEWSAGTQKWVGLATTMNRTAHTVSVDSISSDVILSVFADGRDAYEGTASWYAHKRYPAGSATNLFPIGTKLKVTNMANNKSTTVTVTSTWTNKNEKRIIDLVSTAFKKIASLGTGLIQVRIEKL